MIYSGALLAVRSWCSVVSLNLLESHAILILDMIQKVKSPKGEAVQNI